jgi:hypothetical protein
MTAMPKFQSLVAYILTLQSFIELICMFPLITNTWLKYKNKYKNDSIL